MGIVKTRRCDVTGTGLDVKSYRVVLEEVARIDDEPDQGESIERVQTVAVITDKVLDLAPRGIKRLKIFIDKGTTATKGTQRKKPEAPVESPKAEAGE